MLLAGKIGIWEIMVIVVAALVIFGPAKLPELGRSIGKSINELKKVTRDLKSSIDITGDMEVDLDDHEKDKEK